MATPKPQELVNTVKSQFPATEWMDTPPDLRPGTFCYAGKPKFVEYLGFPFPREWNPKDADWKLPANWKEIILEGIRDRLLRFRSFTSSWTSACAAAPAATSATSSSA